MNYWDLLPANGAAPAGANDSEGASTPDLWGYAEQRSKALGVPITLTRNLMQMESGGNPDAVSYKGAAGAMQVMPDTMREMGYDPDTASARDNVDAGLGYLLKQHDRFGSWEKALAAYHAGPGAVERAGGIPNTSDGLTTTPNYVRTVMAGVNDPNASTRARMPGRPGASNIWDLLPASDAAPTSDMDAMLAKSAGPPTPGIVDRLKQTGSDLLRNARLTATTNPEDAANLIAQGQQTALPQSPAQMQMAKDMQPLQQEYKDASGTDAMWVAAKIFAKKMGQYASNPTEAIDALAEGAVGSAPAILGMVGGGALGGPVGAIAGGTAGGAIPGVGSDFEQRVIQQAQAQGVDPRDPKALLPIVQQNFAPFMDAARKKGITSAGVNTVINVLTMGAAGVGERVLTNEAGSIIKGVTEDTLGAVQANTRVGALQAAAQQYDAPFAKVLRGSGVVAGQAAAGGGGEAAGEAAAGDEIDPLKIADNTILSAVPGVGEALLRHPLSKAIGVGGESSVADATARARATVDAISKAPDVNSAIQAAVKAAGDSPGVVLPEVAARAPEAPEAPAAPELPQAPAIPSEAERIASLRAQADENAKQQAALNAQRGSANLAEPNSGTNVPNEGSLYGELPQAATREALLAKQSRVDEQRAAAGLPRSTGEEAEHTPPQPARGNAFDGSPDRPMTVVDGTPMDPRQAMNRLTVMRDQLQQQGGDPASLQIVNHPTIPGKLAIRTLDQPEPLNPLRQGNAALAQEAGVGVRPREPVLDPVQNYIKQKSQENTPQAREFVRSYNERKISDADVQAIIDREQQLAQQQATAPPLTYDREGNPNIVGVPPVGNEPGVTTRPERVSRTTGEIEPGAPTTMYRGDSPERQEIINERFKRPELPGSITEEGERPSETEHPGEEPPTVEAPGAAAAGELPVPGQNRDHPVYTEGRETEPPAASLGPMGHGPPQGAQWEHELPARTDNPTLRAAVEAGDKQAVAKFLAGHPNPVIARVGQLAMLNKHFTIGVLRRGHPGVYTPDFDTVHLRSDYAGNEHVVAHEIVHALTARAMRKPANGHQEMLLDRAKTLYSFLRRQVKPENRGNPAREWYGLVNEREMMSEAFTNRDFQAWLSKINVGKTSAWSKFVKMVADFLGIKDKNALTEVLEVGTKIMDAQLKRHPTKGFMGGSRRRDTTQHEVDYAPDAAERDANLAKFMEGSKVVDEQGKPLTVYHGTSGDDFKTFKPFSHFGSTQAANERSTWLAHANIRGSQRTIPAYLAIRNPLRVEDVAASDPMRFISQWQNGRIPELGEFPGWPKSTSGSKATEFVTRELERRGFDGLVYKNDVEDAGHDSYVALHPEQIKSATGNRGTFDPRSPEIDAMPEHEAQTGEARSNPEAQAADHVSLGSTIESATHALDNVKTSRLGQWLSTAWDGVKMAVAPQYRTAAAREMGHQLTAGLGEKELGQVRFRQQLDTAIKETAKANTLGAKMRDLIEKGLSTASDKVFLRNTPEENHAFMQAMDTGDEAYFAQHPDLKPLADVINKMFADKAQAVQALDTGALQTLRENYFPHIWKQIPTDEVQRQIFARLSKRPLEGQKEFTRERTFEDVRAGLDAGYEPISHNPLDLVALKMDEMDKYILAHKVLNAMDGSDGVHLIRAGDATPRGYADVNGRFGNITRDGQQMRYVARDDVGQVINNYLSKSLYNNKYVGKPFTAYMGAANALNQFQLGVFSAFHAGFTSMEAVISHGALGLKSLAAGDFKGAAKYLGSAPAAWLTNPRMGDKILKEMLTPGAQPEMAHIIQGLQMAGFKWQMDNRFRTTATKSMLAAWSEGKPIKAGLHSIMAITEQSARPILEYLVPRQKFGVFGEMYNKWIEDHPNATHEELRNSAQQIWNRVDSRLGQVVYDRLFTHNVAKNFAQMLVRAPGWTGGTILELGGGMFDLAKFAKDLPMSVAKGTKRPELSDRAAYTLSLLMTTAVANAALTAMFTGEAPQDWRDLVAFRTGNMDEHGRPERFMLPTYGKDVYAYINAPGTTLVNKAHPLLSLLGDVVRNHGYYGDEVRSEDSNVFTQLAQVAGYGAKAFVPFWARGLQKEREREGSPLAMAAPFVGVMPAPSDLNKTDAERLVSHYAADKAPQGARTSDEMQKADLRRQMYVALRKGDYSKAKEAYDQGREAGLFAANELSKATKQSTHDPLVNNFARLTYEQAQHVMDVATDDERQELEGAFAKKRATYMKEHSGATADQ